MIKAVLYSITNFRTPPHHLNLELADDLNIFFGFAVLLPETDRHNKPGQYAATYGKYYVLRRRLPFH